MDNNVEILNDDEIIIVDADEVFNVNEINIDVRDLEEIKEVESQIGKATSTIAAAAKLQRKAVDELETAEEIRQSLIRKLASKYDVPQSSDWQIDLANGKIILIPEKR